MSATARLCILALLALPACAKSGKTSEKSRPRFTVGEPGPDWDRVDPGSADRAWFHKGISGSIYGDANCGARYEDGELADLARHLGWGIARGRPERSESMVLDRREALLQVNEGQLDGVKVKVGLLVTKQDDCLYDLLYIAPPATFEQGWPDFVLVLQGFQGRGRTP